MRHPAYHLRPNKAVDRLALIEAICRLASFGDLSQYTYYGFGGPYLEDFRLMYELCPGIKMFSIEENEETYKRQKFHLPCGTLRLERGRFKSFLAQYESKDEKSIFWLDYTALEYGHFEDFMVLLGKVAAGSMVKITLRSEPSDYRDKSEEFQQRFAAIMPGPSADPPRELKGFACLLQDMLQVSAQKTLPGAMPLMFQPVSSFYYSDGTAMFTLTGVVCLREEETKTKNAFKGWQFANLNWAKPKRIDVPILSTKERLHLQSRLPCSKNAGRILRQALGYLIDDDRDKTEAKFKQYADFHRYSPYYMRAIP